MKHEFLCRWRERHVDTALSGKTVSTEIVLLPTPNDKSVERPRHSRMSGLVDALLRGAGRRSPVRKRQ
jgi:hypothetical protein